MSKSKLLNRVRAIFFELYLPSIIFVLIIIGCYFVLALVLNTPTPLRIVEIDMQPWWETSMYPALMAGDIIVVEGIDWRELKVGDVILFKRPYGDKIIVHRIIEILDEGGSIVFRTKGDNNLYPDFYLVRSSDLVGRWTGVKVQFIGLAILLAQTEIGRMVIIGLLILLTIQSIFTQETQKESPEIGPTAGL